MPADTKISVFHGAGAVATEIQSTTLRFKREDNDVQDGNDPIPAPATGFNYSWRKSFKLTIPVSDVGPDTRIENLRVFSQQESLGTDRTILITTNTAYVQGSVGDETVAVTGTAPQAASVDVDTFTVSVPLTLESGQVFGSGATGVGSQPHLVLQARVGPTAVAGNTSNAKGIVMVYDEL